MKYAIMSDVHANPLALGAALSDARELGCERFVFLGDVTGYGYDAQSALKQVRESFDVVLMGNHDSAAIGKEPQWILDGCPNYAADIRQGRGLAAEDIRWIGALPYSHAEKGLGFVHGNFIDPSTWEYVDGAELAGANFDACGEKFLFCGHTHEAAVWMRSGNGRVEALSEGAMRRPALKPESLRIVREPGARYLVNVGSVGYPRHDFCSTYAVVDPEGEGFGLRRLPFDFKAYAKNLIETNSEIPDWLLALFGLSR